MAQKKNINGCIKGLLTKSKSTERIIVNSASMNRGGPHENTMSRLSTKLTLNYGCRLGNSKCLYSESTDKGWLVSAQRDVVWHDVVCLSLAAVP